MTTMEPSAEIQRTRPKGNFQIILKDLDTGNDFVVRTTDLNISQNYRMPAGNLPIEQLIGADVEVVSTVIAFAGGFELAEKKQKKGHKK